MADPRDDQLWLPDGEAPPEAAEIEDFGLMEAILGKPRGNTRNIIHRRKHTIPQPGWQRDQRRKKNKRRAVARLRRRRKPHGRSQPCRDLYVSGMRHGREVKHGS